jgi:hypothetical protein
LLQEKLITSEVTKISLRSKAQKDKLKTLSPKWSKKMSKSDLNVCITQ